MLNMRLLDRILSGVVILVAACVVFLAAKRELSRSNATDPLRIEFKALDESAVVKGLVQWLDSSGTVDVVQFSDFECPFCRGFSETVNGLPDSLRRLVREGVLVFPLPNHAAAQPAALEFLCADQLQRRLLHDALFDAQDSLARTGVQRVLASRGLGMSEGHRSCVRSASGAAIVDSSIAIGNRLGVRATPTVIVGGWLLSRPPTAAQLEKLVRAAAAGNDIRAALR